MSMNVSAVQAAINALKSMTAKDSITPSILGNILNSIANLLSDATSQKEVESVKNALDTLKSTQVVSDLFFSVSDSGLSVSKKLSNLTDGSVKRESVDILPEVSANSPGLMTAQLYRTFDNLQRTVESIQQREPSLGSIEVAVIDGRLCIRGARKFLDAGFVPVLFRLSRKRNKIRDKLKTHNRKFSPLKAKRGWNAFGHSHNLLLVSGLDYLKLFISKTPRNEWSRVPKDYPFESPASMSGSGRFGDCPLDFVKPYQAHDGDGHLRDEVCVGIGKKRVVLYDNNGCHAGIFRFALAFVKPHSKRYPVTTANIVSNLAEFSVRFCPGTDVSSSSDVFSEKRWTFCK